MAPNEMLATWEDMTTQFGAWGVVCPRVPHHLRQSLRGSVRAVSTDGVDLDALAGYDLEFGRREGTPPRYYLDDRWPDYVVASGRDNGYGSYWGFVVRSGGVLASVQEVLGSIDGAASLRASATFDAFNTHLAPLLSRGDRPLSIAVLLSRYRDYAALLARGRWISSPTSGMAALLTGWREIDWRDDEGSASAVDELRSRCDDPEAFGAAVAFLREVFIG